MVSEGKARTLDLSAGLFYFMRKINNYFLRFCAAALSFCALTGSAQAKRVVSLMPSYTEIIYELGAGSGVVGVTNFCTWPPAALKVEKTGDYLRPNVEKIYSLKPDVVFAGAWAAENSSKQLSGLGIKVVQLPEEKKVKDIFSTIRLIAAELGRRAEGEKLIKKLSLPWGAKTANPGLPKKVYLEADNGGWTTGGESFLSDAVNLAGGKNIFGDEKKGYFQASWEEVLLLDPEAVILLSGTKEEFLTRPMAADIAAAKNGLIITSLNRDSFSRPGPRIFGEIKKLYGLLHDKK